MAWSIELGDLRLVRLYKDWLSCSHGAAFQHALDELLPGCLSFVEEMRLLTSTTGNRKVVSISARKLKVMEVISSLILGTPQYYAFVRLAAALALMEEELMPDKELGWETIVDLPPLQPAIVKLLATLRRQISEPRPSRRCSQEELQRMRQDMYPLPFGEVQLHVGSAVEVSNLVCELVFTWLASPPQQQHQVLLEDMDARLHAHIGELCPDAVNDPLLAFFLLTANFQTLKLATPGSFRVFTQGSRFLVRSHRPGALDVTDTVRKLCKEVAATSDCGTAKAGLESWLSSSSLLYRRRQLQQETTVEAVESAAQQMRRLWNSWRSKLPDSRGERLDQVLHGVLENRPGHAWERKRAIWESVCPYGPAAARSFANLVTAASMVEGERENATLMELDAIHLAASCGEYTGLKLFYPETHPAVGKSISWVVMRLVEEVFVALGRGDHFAKGVTSDDEARDCQLLLPGASRDALEHRMSGPTIVAVRDVTKPACELLNIWMPLAEVVPLFASHKHLSGLDVMLECLKANGGGRGDVNIEDAIQTCWYAARDESLALLTRGVEVGPLMYAVTRDVHTAYLYEAKQQQGHEQQTQEKGGLKPLAPNKCLCIRSPGAPAVVC